MWQTRVWAISAGLAIIGSSAWASAQCATNQDCKGDRTCQQGQCVATTPASPATTATPAPAAPPTTAAPAPPSPQPTAPPVTPPAAPPITEPVAPPAPPAAPPEPATRRRSTPMVIGGGLMVATGPLLIALSLLTKNIGCEDIRGSVTTAEQERCDNDVRTYGLAIGGVLLVGGGIPLIIVGIERVPAEPAAQAAIAPWLGPDLAGVQLRLDL